MLSAIHPIRLQETAFIDNEAIVLARYVKRTHLGSNLRNAFFKFLQYFCGLPPFHA
jgi:hypothetical protein